MAVVVGVFAGPAADSLMRPLAHDGSERVNVLLSPHYCSGCTAPERIRNRNFRNAPQVMPLDVLDGG